MPSRDMLFGDEARLSLKRGVDALASAVGVTLGPAGRNVALDRRSGLPLIVNDGVTVARDIELSDPAENVGAVLLREAATKTEQAAGDGTTTATVLAQAILDVGFRHLAFGADPMQLKSGLEAGRDAVIGAIRAAAIPVTDRAQTANVATISANDRDIGELVADVLDRVGREGAIDIEESQTLRHSVEYVEGLVFDGGYLSGYFVTEPEGMKCIIEKPRILITDGEIAAVTDLVPILDRLVAAGERVLMVLANDVRGEALATLVVNRIRGTLDVVAVKAVEFGDRRRELLDDLGAMTGATVLGGETGRALKDAELTDLGRAGRVVVTSERTTIVGGGGHRRAVRRRAKALQAQLADASDGDERNRLRRRLARLTGRVAVIRIGAATEVEYKERQHRFDDAVLAARAALEEGIVPGGGATLLHAIDSLGSLALSGDAAVGVECLASALREPLRRIADNAGYDGGLVVATVQQRQATAGGRIGFDAVSGRYVDMVEAGIVDPAKVVRSEVENAASVAAMILLAETVVTESVQDADRALPTARLA
jgi:chaperonin GroEL